MSETNVQGEAMPSVNAVNVLSPLGPHDQFLSQNLRCQVALGFRHIIGDIRLAHKYAVIGWTGTLDQAKIPDALSQAPSIGALNMRLDALEAALAPFLPSPFSLPPPYHHYQQQHHRGPGAVIDPSVAPAPLMNGDTLLRIEDFRARLLAIAPGTRSHGHLERLVHDLETDAQTARLLPPHTPGSGPGAVGLLQGEAAGRWRWSWEYDDWFRWDEGEGKWFGEHYGWWSRREGL